MNFAHWAIVAHKDDTGFGRLAIDMRSLFGLGWHLVIPSLRLWDHALTGPNEVILDSAYPDSKIRELLEGLSGIIVFERPWHPKLFSLAKEVGVRTICIPMWEWFSKYEKQWQYCDLFACPSLFSLQMIRKCNFKNSLYLPAPLDISRFPARQVSGTAHLFVHNAGLVDYDDRKGTKDTIAAFKQLKRDDVNLIVRLQKEASLPPLDSRITIEVANLSNPAQLYATGDVAIQPSKMEGLGLMIVEPWLSGMPVVTTNYPPMNEFVQTAELLVKKQWFKRKAYANHWIKQAHLRLPNLADLTKKIQWCCDNDLTDISKLNRQAAERLFNPASIRSKWSNAIAALEEGNLNSMPEP